MAQAQQAGQPNREYAKKPGKNRFSHVQNTPYGMGDHYGTGIRAKLGRVRGDSMGIRALTPKKLKAAPRSIV
jgi:hypothetical protein